MAEKFTVAKENRYIIPVSIILSITIVLVFWCMAFIAKSYFESNAEIEKEKLVIEKEKIRLNSTITMDKLTFCIQTVMEASTKAGKNIEAKQAKEICKDVKTNEEYYEKK